MLLMLMFMPALAVGAILKNADFDGTTYSPSAGWWCLECTASASTDRHSGSHSVKVTNRKHEYSGITQTFPASAGRRYAFRAYVKILNLAQGKMYHTMDVYLEIKDNNGNSKYEMIGTTPHIKPGDWHVVGGDYQMPGGFKEVRLYYQIHEPQVNYLLDTASITEIPHINNLKSETNRRIDQLRKANINIRVTDNHVNPSGLTLDLHQTSSEFGWGSAIDANYIVDSQHKKYQDYFYDNFEWAVPENALKWYSMEPNEGQNNVAVPEKAINALRSRGIKVRGHNIFWAVDKWAPGWQKTVSPSKLKQEMQYRFSEAVGHFRGKFGQTIFRSDLPATPDVSQCHFNDVLELSWLYETEIWFSDGRNGNGSRRDPFPMRSSRFDLRTGHFSNYRLPHWDVNNENTHGDFYAQRLLDPDITMWMFREAHKADPSTLLFLNDFDIVSGHQHTVALEDQAQYLKNKGVPVQRIGIQSHLASNAVDLDSIKHRLDEVARAGLRMWITELDINDGNENSKADKYEQVLRLYFSHPSIDGIMFWGFWDGRHWLPQAALANGPNVTPNAAGRRVRQLIKGEWRTNESHPVREGQTVKIRGFKGGYNVQVKHNGQVIKTQQFTLGGNDVDVTISLSGSGNNPHVNNIIIG